MAWRSALPGGAVAAEATEETPRIGDVAGDLGAQLFRARKFLFFAEALPEAPPRRKEICGPGRAARPNRPRHRQFSAFLQSPPPLPHHPAARFAKPSVASHSDYPTNRE